MPTLETLPDGRLLVECDTAAEALEQVGAQLGADAEILSAQKVHRGGWNGFFAHEVVQLVARARSATCSSAAPPTTLGGTSVDPAATEGKGLRGLDAVLADMVGRAESREESFHEVLAREFATAGAVPDGPSPNPEAMPSATAADRPQEPRAGTQREHWPAAGGAARSQVGWGIERLHELRLPETIIAACEGLDPGNDSDWVMAVARAVSSWCRPLPARDSVFVGPRAHRLASGLGLPTAAKGELVDTEGCVGLRVTDSETGRAFVDEVRGDRWEHLVVGGARWQGFLLNDVAAVSWVGDEAVPSAVAAASRFGLVLGYGLGSSTGRSPIRVAPMDVALAIRSLLPRPIS